MTPDQITQLRKILKEIHRWTIEESGIVCPHKFGTCKHDNKKCPVYLIEDALALLPCPTCNGAKKVFKPRAMRMSQPCPNCQSICKTCHGTKMKRLRGSYQEGSVYETCPDCQPRTCVCCEEVTKENAHLHRNCGK